MKSIRSIQNQSLKNIEIIIINDCSSDNTSKYFNTLLKNDFRIRIFTHLKNMGLWRSRLDGILYSRGKYIICFDNGDLYEDNYVLEEAYNIMEYYKLDSAKFLFRLTKSLYGIENSSIPFHIGNHSNIIFDSKRIEKYNNFIFRGWGNIWNRIVRSNIYIKGLYLLNDFILNLYKNIWDDIWCNTLINKVSNSFAIYERIGYIYIQDGNGEGTIKLNDDNKKDKIIQEFLYFLYFDYNILPKNDNKIKIINKLKEYSADNAWLQLKFLKSNFYVLNDLLFLLIHDPYVSHENKTFLSKLVEKYKRKKEI
jgi:glycosyltransferase involved in cell wall biosynthesis